MRPCAFAALPLPAQGTSMACPVAASSATLVRQYFLNGFYPAGAGAREGE